MRKTRVAKKQIMGLEVLEVQVCQHHWVIEPPNGPTSRGLCRNCGESRDFLNYADGSSWGSDVSLDQLAGGSRIPTRLGIGAVNGFPEDEDN